MGGFSSLNPTKDFRGSVISRLHIFQKKPFIRNRAVFPFFVDCEKIFSFFLSDFSCKPKPCTNLSVHYCVQFLPIRKMKKYNAGLPSVGFNKSEVLSIRLKPSFTILLETVLLYSLKLPILFSTIEFHNTPYHFTSSPLLS